MNVRVLCVSVRVHKEVITNVYVCTHIIIIVDTGMVLLSVGLGLSE